MRIYTMGTFRKNAETFFELLRENNVKMLIDIRSNEGSHSPGFATRNNLIYFLKTILNIEYRQDACFSGYEEPPKKSSKDFINWNEYEIALDDGISEEFFKSHINSEYISRLDSICLLCCESEANHCIRRLVAECMKDLVPEVEIVHL